METTRNLDKEYLEWIADLSQRYRQSQIKAAMKVNSEMLKFYWTIGKDITERQYDNKYGTRFYENLSRDLSLALNKKKGFSPTNLKYAKYFYILYSPMFPNRHQPADDLEKIKRPQFVDKLYDANRQQVVDKSTNTNRHQLADDFEMLFQIPWVHHHRIIDKCSDNPKKALFFVRKTLENQWGRSVLMNFLSTDLYESQGAALTNFDTTLPKPESDLAQDYFKDPYHFEFLQMNEEYTEKDLKDALMDKLVQFLIELGKGFSFVGREYRLSAGGKDKFIDLLFYIIPLHRYCIIEVKTTEFDFPDIGQLAGYVAMVDDLMNTPIENSAIGLLICKEKNTVMARYALSQIKSPIGISEYEVAKQQLPKELQDKLPSVEEIEQRLKAAF